MALPFVGKRNKKRDSVVMAFPFNRGLKAVRGAVDSNTQLSGGSTIDYLGRQVDGDLHESMHYGMRRAKNYCEDSDNLLQTAGSTKWYEEGTTETIDFETVELKAGTQDRILYINGDVDGSNRVWCIRSYVEYVSGTLTDEVIIRIQGNGPDYNGTGRQSTYALSELVGGKEISSWGTPTGDSSNGIRLRIQGENTNVSDVRIKIKSACIFDTTGDTNPDVPHEKVSTKVGLGNELSPNVTFDSDIDGWSGFDAQSTVEWDAGTLKVTNGDTSAAKGTFSFTSILNEEYLFSVDFIRNGVDGGRVHVGTSAGGTQLYDSGNLGSSQAVNGKFLGTGATVYISLTTNNSLADRYTNWDNASLKSLSHGAGVDGVKYFDTDKSHISVDVNGVVTESATKTLLTTGKGIQCAPEATNENTISSDISSWANNGVGSTITPYNYKGRRGGNTVDKLTGNATGSDGKLRTITLANSTLYTLQSDLVYEDSTLARVGIHNNSLSAWEGYVDVNPSTNPPTTVGSSGASNIGYIDWYGDQSLWVLHYQMTTTANVAAEDTRILVQPDRNGTSQSVGLSCVNVHTLPFPILAIDTDGSTETRDGSDPAVIWLGGNSNFELEVELFPQAYDTVTARHVFAIGDDANDHMRCYIGAGDGRARWDIKVAGTGHVVQTNDPVTVDSSTVIRFRFLNGVMTMYVNDVLQTDTELSVPSLAFSSLLLHVGGSYSGGTQLYGCEKLLSVKKL